MLLRSLHGTCVLLRLFPRVQIRHRPCTALPPSLCLQRNGVENAEVGNVASGTRWQDLKEPEQLLSPTFQFQCRPFNREASRILSWAPNHDL